MSRVFVMAPGAGLPASSPWMTRWADRLSALGEVVRFDYPYRLAGRSRPDRLPVLMARHSEVLAEVRNRHPEASIMLIGKSMGSRVGCHVAAADPATPIRALVCLGYPLLGGGKPDKRRDQVLRELRTPIQFVQGTRDRMCPIDDLEALRPELTAPSALHVVETGDHSLVVTKTHTKQTGRTQDDVEASAVQAIGRFLDHLPTDNAAATQG